MIGQRFSEKSHGFKVKSMKPDPRAAVSKKQAVSIMMQVIRQQRTQTRKDVEDWKQAKRMAENPDKPNRRKLIEIYQDAIIDGHLLSQMNNRIIRVTNKKFKIVDRNTKVEDIEKTKLLKKKWFKNFTWHSLESIFYGYSLIEFKELNEKGEFKKVSLVYREHVLPNREEFLLKPTDEKGIKFTEPPYSNWHIGVGDTEDLGLLLQLSLYAIYKKNTWSSWNEFEEMFGVPIRIAKTASTDSRVKAEIMDWLEEMGSAAYGIFPDDTTLDIKESSQADAFQVFEQ
ncbi:MAG: DUF935 domain-containing protein, partial [Hymenobacteraceae bacterium]|nr:DUF935 domain-containing protein [Hymenobacteraceae bacterium]